MGFWKRFLLYFFIIIFINLTIDFIFIKGQVAYLHALIEKDTTADNALKKEMLHRKFESILDDLEFLKDYLEYWISSGVSPNKIDSNIIAYIARFGEIDGRYRAIRILDSHGMELGRVEYFLGNMVIAKGSQLHDFSKEKCYSDVMYLGEDEYSFDGFDLCNGNKGDNVLRFVSGLYDERGKRFGSLVFEYNGNFFLNELVRYFYYDDATTYLVDGSGRIIYYVTPSELGSNFLRVNRILSENFKDMFPAVWDRIKNNRVGQIGNGKDFFVYTRLDIPKKGRRTIGVNFVAEWADWKLISVVNISDAVRSALRKYIFNLVVGSAIALVVAGFILALYVISDIRRTDMKNKLSEEASFFKNSPFPVLKTDKEGFILRYNKIIYNCFQRDLVGANVVEVFKGLSRKRFDNLDKEKSITFEEKCQEKKYIFTVVRDEIAGSCFFYGNDVTALEKRNLELKMLNAAIEQSAETVFITETNGTIVYANKAIEKLTGYKPVEVIGKNPRIFKSGRLGNRFYKRFWDTITSGNTWEGEFINKRKDGSLYWEKAIVTPVRDREGKITNFIAIKEDVSLQKEAEKMLREAKKRAEDSNKLKSLFLANMSHEIRTPLNAVLGFTQLLMDEENDENKLEQLKIIKDSGEYLLHLINDILDFSKIEANRLELHYSPFSIKEMMQNLQEMFEIKANEKGISFYVGVDENSPQVVVGDEHRIKQVIINLVGNAIKFTDNGFVRLYYAYRDNSMVFTIEDSGIGMDEEQLKWIFEPFKQLDDSLTKKYEGTGLGLSISKRLVDLMKGNIEVSSVKGRGSSFVVKIPAEIGEEPFIKGSIGANGVESKVKISKSDGWGMLQRWIVEAEKDGLVDILYQAIGKLQESVSRLEDAIDRDDVTEIHSIAHSTKGFVGTLKMNEIYEIFVQIENESFKKNYSMEKIKELFSELKNRVYSIPFSNSKFDTHKNHKFPQLKNDYRILVVEDNEVNLKLIVKLLEKMGLSCDTAENGKVAIDKLHSTVYDLVLLDINMPVVDGISVFMTMKEEAMLDGTYVIALTAYAMKGEAEKYLSLGFHDYISKPIDTDLFKEKIERIVAIKKDLNR